MSFYNNTKRKNKKNYSFIIWLAMSVFGVIGDMGDGNDQLMYQKLSRDDWQLGRTYYLIVVNGASTLQPVNLSFYQTN